MSIASQKVNPSLISKRRANKLTENDPNKGKHNQLREHQKCIISPNDRSIQAGLRQGTLVAGKPAYDDRHEEVDDTRDDGWEDTGYDYERGGGGIIPFPNEGDK